MSILCNHLIFKNKKNLDFFHYFVGLQCYHCFYYDTAVPPNSFSEPSEISCQGVNNTLPSERFLVDCDNYQYHNVFGEFDSEEEEQQNGSQEVEYENIEPRFTCAKLIFNGTLVEKFNNSPFRGILRSCLPGRPGKPKQFREGCASGNLSNVINESQDEELRLMLSILSQIAFVNDTQTVACTCNNATCNNSL
ncbi:unnamed protein product [Orchesella dallaii]|uniref:Uncharacterized protein n=1 Tax=Orchesella dallaii TaxID=48710 RepID=A0ABP1PS99_9HEXA